MDRVALSIGIRSGYIVNVTHCQNSSFLMQTDADRVDLPQRSIKYKSGKLKHGHGIQSFTYKVM